jgi:putative ABC transport system permease protein
MRREYRSTYRDSLTASERLTAGRWPPTARDASGLPGISVESGVAADMGVSLGDTITWDVQGVRVPTIVRSIRDVEWARFEPNFFVVFESRAIDDAPQTYVVLTHADDDTERARLQHAAATALPNVTSIDLTLIQRTLARILDRVAVAVRFMALLSVATGIIVLVGAVTASRRQRMREGVLLKTLGATRVQIARVMLAEYGVLGAMGSATGILLSVGGAWGVMRFLFHAPFRPALPQMAVLTLGMMLLTAGIGFLGSRDVFRATALAALREV